MICHCVAGSSLLSLCLSPSDANAGASPQCQSKQNILNDDNKVVKCVKLHVQCYSIELGKENRVTWKEKCCLSRQYSSHADEHLYFNYQTIAAIRAGKNCITKYGVYQPFFLILCDDTLHVVSTYGNRLKLYCSLTNISQKIINFDSASAKFFVTDLLYILVVSNGSICVIQVETLKIENLLIGPQSELISYYIKDHCLQVLCRDASQVVSIHTVIDLPQLKIQKCSAENLLHLDYHPIVSRITVMQRKETFHVFLACSDQGILIELVDGDIIRGVSLPKGQVKEIKCFIDQYGQELVMIYADEYIYVYTYESLEVVFCTLGSFVCWIDDINKSGGYSLLLTASDEYSDAPSDWKTCQLQTCFNRPIIEMMDVSDSNKIGSSLRYLAKENQKLSLELKYSYEMKRKQLNGLFKELQGVNISETDLVSLIGKEHNQCSPHENVLPVVNLVCHLNLPLLNIFVFQVSIQQENVQAVSVIPCMPHLENFLCHSLQVVESNKLDAVSRFSLCLRLPSELVSSSMLFNILWEGHHDGQQQCYPCSFDIDARTLNSIEDISKTDHSSLILNVINAKVVPLIIGSDVYTARHLKQILCDLKFQEVKFNLLLNPYTFAAVEILNSLSFKIRIYMRNDDQLKKILKIITEDLPLQKVLLDVPERKNMKPMIVRGFIQSIRAQLSKKKSKFTLDTEIKNADDFLKAREQLLSSCKNTVELQLPTMETFSLAGNW